MRTPHLLSRLRSPHHRRGVSLIELAVAMIVLAIIIIVGFSIFAWHQSRMVQLEIREQMQMVLDNEVEWALSTHDYADVESRAESVNFGGREFYVVVDVEERDTNGENPRWKHVEITVFYGGENSAEADLEASITTTRSRSR